MPKTFSVDAATAYLNELITAILNPAPASPFSAIDTKKLPALETITTIFQTPDKPNHEKSTDKPVPIPVRPVRAKLPRVATPPETDANTPY